MSVQNFQPTLEIGEAITPIVQTLGATETEILDASKPGWYYQLNGLIISNISGVARTVTIYLHADGVAGAAGNTVLGAVNVNANTTYLMFIPITIPAGYTLSGLASAASAINVTVTGKYIVEAPLEVQQ